MIHRAYRCGKFAERNINPPPNIRPIVTDLPKLAGLGVFVTIRLRYTDRFQKRLCIGKYDVSRANTTHEVVGMVVLASPIQLGGPQIASRHLVSVCLLLVYPPVIQFTVFRHRLKTFATLIRNFCIRYLPALFFLAQHTSIDDQVNTCVHSDVDFSSGSQGPLRQIGTTLPATDNIAYSIARARTQLTWP